MNAGESTLTLEPGRPNGAGLVLVHAWWGLNDFARRLAARFAAQGYRVVAPDLFDGRVANTVEEAAALRRLMTAIRREPAYRILERAAQELTAAGVARIGTVGISMGGHWAWWLAGRGHIDVRATVAFYAARNGNFAHSRSAFLAHFAEHDAFVSRATTRRLLKNLQTVGRPAEFHTYPGTRHWFFEDDRPEFDAAAAGLAWDRTLAFLDTRLASR
jgi:carboxymethylenebutenolidase